MEITYTLCLPRDEVTVPIVRRLCTGALTQLGVTQSCCSDIEVALAEACTNVLKHATAEDQYEVSVAVNDTHCEIRVVDNGAGFDQSLVPAAGDGDEGGRGIELMRALVDNIRFESRPESGTIVHLIKRLRLEDDAAMHQLRSTPAS